MQAHGKEQQRGVGTVLLICTTRTHVSEAVAVDIGLVGVVHVGAVVASVSEH